MVRHLPDEASVPVTPLDLLGDWTFTRTIDDRAASEQLAVEGAMRLELQPDGRVCWSETGVLTRQQQTTPVSRTLFIERRADGWFVTFSDGRDFHPWTTGEHVEHPCGPDVYRGHITVDDPTSRWGVEWVVEGPAKDYSMWTAIAR